MKKMSLLVVGIVLLVGGFYMLQSHDQADGVDTVVKTSDDPYMVTPVSHASFVLEFAGATIYNDPVGDIAAYAAFSAPDIILISDVHGDHLNVETLEGVVGTETVLVVPQAVYDELPARFASSTVVMGNGDRHELLGISLEAVPMYNLPMEGSEYRHVKGRGNGYVLENSGTRIYIAGDTEDTEELRSLEAIDVAFIPMNVPYTMDVVSAADGVLDFAPQVVYPYHYRGTEGLSDVDEFERLVTEGNESIEVRLLDWYPETE